MSKINLIKTIGDIFDTKADAIVNAVNCIGIMGGGIAKRFADEFPEMYEDYKKECKQNKINIGECHFYNLKSITYNISNDRILEGQPLNEKQLSYNWTYVINCPTMYYPGSIADPIEVLHSLYNLIYISICKKINTIAMPYLGCGIGQLSKEEFEKILNTVIKMIEETIDFEGNISILLVEYKN